MEKAELRTMIRQRIVAQNTRQRALEEATLISRILKEPLWQKAKCIFCYISTELEINTYPLLEDALAQGKLLAAPFVIGQGIMEARRLNQLSGLRRDCFGIPTPSSKNARVKPEDIDLAVVPGLAYDRTSLLRLGRGGGYYDRFLANCNAYRLAPALACQMVDELIPRDNNDLEMDMVVTATALYTKKTPQ